MIGKISNLAGTCIVILIILISIPFCIPQLLGYEMFSVLSSSMEPVYQKGSVVYVKPLSPDQIHVGDSITYRMSEGTDSLTTHRVVEIDPENQLFMTKGDANDSEDAEQVAFGRLVGKVSFSIPLLGKYAQFIKSVPGIIVGVFLFLIAILLWYIGAMYSPKRKKSK